MYSHCSIYCEAMKGPEFASDVVATWNLRFSGCLTYVDVLRSYWDSLLSFWEY